MRFDIEGRRAEPEHGRERATRERVADHKIDAGDAGAKERVIFVEPFGRGLSRGGVNSAFSARPAIVDDRDGLLRGSTKIPRRPQNLAEGRQG